MFCTLKLPAILLTVCVGGWLPATMVASTLYDCSSSINIWYHQQYGSINIMGASTNACRMNSFTILIRILIHDLPHPRSPSSTISLIHDLPHPRFPSSTITLIYDLLSSHLNTRPNVNNDRIVPSPKDSPHPNPDPHHDPHHDPNPHCNLCDTRHMLGVTLPSSPYGQFLNCGGGLR